MPAARRFPPPWTIEEHNNACFIRDATGQALGYSYFEEEVGLALSGCPLQGNCGHRLRFERDGSVANDRAAKLAAIPAGESPANRGVQSLL